MGAVAAGAAASAAGPCCGPSTEQEHVNRVLRFPNAGTIALVVASCLAPLSLAHADACRVKPNVAESADPDKNTGMNGHVTAHILGMRPPKGESQSGRTLFADKTKAGAACRQYQYVKDPVGCSGKAASQSVSLKDLGISNLDAYSCTAANANGECTAKTLYVAKSVFFGFILDPTYKWILNTMYPEPLQ